MKLPLILSLCVMIFACSSERHAGKGVASETTNGTIAGVLVKVDGSPVVGARVELRDPVQIGDQALVTFDSTNAKGEYRFEVESSGRYYVWNKSSEAGASAWVQAGDSGVTTLQQKALTSLFGKVTGDLQDMTQLRVWVNGMSKNVPVAEDSSFEITGMPVGNYLVSVMREGSSEVIGEAMLETNRVGAVSISKQASVMVDDFEGPEGYSSLFALLDGAWWGMWNDTSAILDSNRTWVNTEGRSTDSSAYAGHSFHAALFVGAPFAEAPLLQRSAGLQIKIGGREDLDSQSVWFDMSAMDSLAFWAKGSGSFEVILNARAGVTHKVCRYTYPIVLSKDWARVAIAAEDFSTPDSCQWAQSELREWLWITNESSTDLWLDELQIIGIRSTDLLRN